MEIKVINLPKAKLRKEYMESQLTGTSFSFFDAFSPNDIDESLFEGRPDFLSKEAVATFETHRKVISSCINEPLLILEDDATPRYPNYLQQINELLKTEHPWDIMILGHFPDPKSNHRPINICEKFMTLDKFIGMHSYIVTPIGAQKIISELGPPITHVDYRISKLIEDKIVNGIFVRDNLFRQNNWDFKSQIPKAIDLLNGKNK